MGSACCSEAKQTVPVLKACEEEDEEGIKHTTYAIDQSRTTKLIYDEAP